MKNVKRATPEIIETRLDKPLAEVIHLTDQHTKAVQSWLPTRYPQAARFDGIGVTAGSSGLEVSLLNLALGGDYPPGADEATISAEIQAVKQFFARRDVPWYWWIGPNPRPRDIGRRLETYGLAFDPPTLPAMAAPLPAIETPELNPAAEVWLADCIEDLQAASTIRRIAFNFPSGVALDYFEAMADDWLRGDPARLYMARLDGGPTAAIGALIMGYGIPGVYIMATLPEWGRRGLGKAILNRILSDAAVRGYDMIALTAGSKGYPLYRQFGFEHVFDYTIYRPVEEDAFE